MRCRQIGAKQLKFVNKRLATGRELRWPQPKLHNIAQNEGIRYFSDNELAGYIRGLWSTGCELRSC